MLSLTAVCMHADQTQSHRYPTGEPSASTTVELQLDPPVLTPHLQQRRMRSLTL